MKILCSCFLLSAFFVPDGCNGPSKVAPPAPQVSQSTPSTSGLIPTGLFEEDPRALEAWHRFAEGGRYRIARRGDFQIPETAMKEHGSDPFFTNEFAYVGGDFNRDGRQFDRAFIVVDTTTTRDKGFGLVMFNAPADERDLPSVHWVYKDQDLSRSVLSAATDVLSLTDFRENGVQEVCNLRWDKNREEYSCKRGR